MVNRFELGQQSRLGDSLAKRTFVAKAAFTVRRAGETSGKKPRIISHPLMALCTLSEVYMQ